MLHQLTRLMLLVCCLGLALLSVCSHVAAQQTIDLAGQWLVQLELDAELQSVKLPGALRDSNIGEPPSPNTNWIGETRDYVWAEKRFEPFRDSENFKMPFWLLPKRRFVGTARYQREISIPESWRGTRIELFLERPHWQTEVFIDQQRVGNNDSLSTPHRFDLTQFATPGKHTLTIAIDNSLSSIDVGHNAHSVSEHTQSAWHGVIGKIELRALPNIAVDRIAVHPNQKGDRLQLAVALTNQTDGMVTQTLAVEVYQGDTQLGSAKIPLQIAAGTSIATTNLALTEIPQKWNEFEPNLCRLSAQLLNENGASTSSINEIFGVRHVSTDNGQITIDEIPIFLRGTLDCCIFPLTGYPPTDIDQWKRIINVCRSYGLNHIRFHSWCPPEAAFVAADEMGFYLQVECSSWPNQSVTLGDNKPIDQWLYREGDRIIAEYGNHPSFLLLAAGNEPSGAAEGGVYLAPWVKHFNDRDDRFLVTGGAGWPAINENQFHVVPQPRTHQWGAGLTSRLNARPPETMTDYRDIIRQFNAPTVAHEIGQWCAFPDLNNIKKYTGALLPTNLEIVSEMLHAAGLANEAERFLMASGKLQALVYKEEIESSLRTPNYGGFQLLDLRDFPGQGTAPIGLVDPFWEAKPYISVDEFSKFCGPVVPLARMKQRIWTTQETFVADIELSNFGERSFEQFDWEWQIRDAEKVIASGKQSKSKVTRAGLSRLGAVEFGLSTISAPAKLSLSVSSPTVTGVNNDWDFWVYPTDVELTKPASIHVAKTLDDSAKQHLQSGGTVLLMLDPRYVNTQVTLGFTPIFWNSLWTNNQPPNTLGISCSPTAPLFEKFPTDSHTDWQWWELIHGSAAMELDRLPTAVQPLIQIVPDWFRPQRLGLLFECRVANSAAGQAAGKLLVCSMDLQRDTERRPAARQMLASIYHYLQSTSFQPDTNVPLADIESLYFSPPMMAKRGAVVSASSAQSGFEAAKIIDGNPQTFWHAAWDPATNPPHWLQIELPATETIVGFRCLPRPDKVSTRISEYKILISNDGTEWQVAATGALTPEPSWHTIRFTQPQTAKFIRLNIVKAHEQRLASLSEFDLLFVEDKSTNETPAEGTLGN